MTRIAPMLPVVLLLLSPAGFSQSPIPPRQKITTVYDQAKDLTTVRLTTAQISGEKVEYYSLHFSVFYTYAGKTRRVPETLSFELLTVVKGRMLDSDLFVVFVADGEEIFLSSDRSAITNPVPGKSWIGERLVFRMPRKTFLKFASAKRLAIKLNGVVFDFGEPQLLSLHDFADAIKVQ